MKIKIRKTAKKWPKSLIKQVKGLKQEKKEMEGFVSTLRNTILLANMGSMVPQELIQDAT